MKVAFDLDGTLDKLPVLELAKALLAAGHEVHVITGMFSDGQEWQGVDAKRRKLSRLGLPYVLYRGPITAEGSSQAVFLHVIEAIPVSSTKNLEYVLRDIGLRKGALLEELGITLLFDDSATYCDMVHRMSGATTAQVI